MIILTIFKAYIYWPRSPSLGGSNFNIGETMKLFTAVLTAFLLTAPTASADQTYRPEILSQSVRRVAQSAHQGKKPVVIFDLDDTLINTRLRNLRIITEFARLPGVRAAFPHESKIAGSLRAEDMKYALAETFSAKNISNPEFQRQAVDYWKARFFTDEYTAEDVPNAGAPAYAKEIHLAGATVIYLTGRDLPGMGRGTEANLLKHGFPLGKRAILMMKPNFEMDDLVFKEQALTQIEQMGIVVAAFDNEPANVNLFHRRFPGADTVFLDTIHSSRPDVPDSGVIWIKDFKY